MRVIAYAYMADIHCPHCTAQDFLSGRIVVDHQHPNALGKRFAKLVDEYGIPMDVVDREGNLIGPVFDIDEYGFKHCSTCHAPI